MNGAEKCVTCAVEELERFAGDVLAKIGMSEEDARYMARIVIASELAGHESHGIRRLSEYVVRWREGKADPKAQLSLKEDSGPIAIVDGQAGFGHVVMRDAMNLAITRAKSHGVSVIAVRRSEAAGRFADYCEGAAEAGVATLVFANDSGGCQEVAPPGGQSARMSTNPIAIGIPRTKSPHLVLDMATSSVASGRLAEARDRQEPIPAEWVNKNGILRHFGGSKGFGLALAVEALAGALTGGGSVGTCPKHDDQAILIIAIDVSHFRPLEEFRSEVDSFLGYIKDVPREEGAAPIRIPGEHGAESTTRLRKTGIQVQPFVRARLRRVADDLGLKLPACLG